jgi:hypothetical protein
MFVKSGLSAKEQPCVVTREMVAAGDITPAMLDAGVEILVDLEGEVSRAFLVGAIYRAMASQLDLTPSHESKLKARQSSV